MKIDRSNYESWFLDYLEGHLDERMIDDFIEFIRENPDLAVLLKNWDPVYLESPLLPFAGKEKLFRKHYDQQEYFDMAVIARMEGDIDPESDALLSAYLLGNPEKQKEAKLLGLTRLVPDPAVVFPSEKRLYRTAEMRRFAALILKIAAVVILSLIVYPLADPDAVYTPKITSLTTDTGTITMDPQSSGKNEKITEQPGVFVDQRKKMDKGQKSSAYTSDTILQTLSAEACDPHIARNTEPVPGFLPMKQPELEAGTELAVLAALPHENPALMADWESQEPASLSERIAEKTGIANIRMKRIARWGLEIASDITREKFSFNTGPSGEITAYNLDTPMLGFSIPVRKKTENE